MVEALLVDGEDHHHRPAEDARVVEGADLEQDGAGQTGRAGRDVRPALGAELARDRIRQVPALELLGRALGPLEAGLRHAHHDVWVPAGDVLALAAVTLTLEHRVTRRLVAKSSAVATALDI